MGFWKNIKGILDPQARAEAIVETQISCFKMCMGRYPERDPNAWLAETLRMRPGWMGRAEVTYYTETAVFSLAPKNQIPLVLGLFILFKQEPALAAAYAHRFEEIMASILRLAQAGQITDRG